MRQVVDEKRRAYDYNDYKCEHCGAFIREHLQRHLVKKHSYTKKDAKLLQTKMRVNSYKCIVYTCLGLANTGQLARIITSHNCV